MPRRTSLWGFEQRGLPVALVTQKDASKLIGGDTSISELDRSGELLLVLVPRIQPDSLRVRVEDIDRFLKRRSSSSWQPLPRWGRNAVLGSEEAAAYLGISVNQIHGLRKDGHIPFLAKPHSSTTTAYKFRASDLDGVIEDWIDAWRRIGT